MDVLFPFSSYWSFYALFVLFVVGLLALDLGVFHRKEHAVSFKEAGAWSIVWISLALVFNVCFYYYALAKFSTIEPYISMEGFNAAENARRVALEFLAGFVVEKSLAVDNLFIFVVIFSYFAIPAKYQHRILFYGILGALFFRGIFIALGSVLMAYHYVVLFFGGLLIVTGIKLFFSPDKPADLENNIFFKLARRWIPMTSKFDGKKFFIKEGKKRFATPLFMALVVVEFSDILFAIDSVPAIFALTKEPLIVFTSNVFAILGLRSLYFMLAGMYDRFHLLKYGLGVILVFVGLKMVWLNDAFGGKFPISWSLGFIGLVLATTITLSLMIKPKAEAAH
jgi:tellurite resistance protein TerC